MAMINIFLCHDSWNFMAQKWASISYFSLLNILDFFININEVKIEKTLMGSSLPRIPWFQEFCIMLLIDRLQWQTLHNRYNYSSINGVNTGKPTCGERPLREFPVLHVGVWETPCSHWKFHGQPQRFLILTKSVRRRVCWTAWQLLSGTTLTPHYHCYDTDAACGKLKVSLTAFLPLPAHAHTHRRVTTESSSHLSEPERGSGQWACRVKKEKIYIFNFTASVARFKALLILLLVFKCPICLTQENRVSS